jgi:archaellum component FlaC
MFGKVTVYDGKKGLGEIVAEDNNVYALMQSNWRDYSASIEEGLEVKFIPNPKTMTAIQVKLLTDEEKKNICFLSDHIKESNENSSGGLKLNYKDKIKPEEFEDLKTIEFIPISLSCIDVFEEFYDKDIEYSSDRSFDSYDYTYDYPKMRKFILTTYNNLKAKDIQFVKGDVGTAYNRLEALYEIYNRLISNIANNKIFYQNAFLQYQDIYLKVEEIYSHNNALISKLDNNSKELEKYIKSKGIKLAKMRRGSEYNELDMKIKRARSNYSNCIDRLGILKKENEHYSKLINEFNEKCQEVFLDFFEKSTQKLLEQITTLMNKNAHKFDTVMWQGAKDSKHIKNFFINSGIEGSYSSRTYIKYFLKNINTNKANSEYKELEELMEFLETNYSKNIMVIDNRSNFSAGVKFLINHIDGFYKTITKTFTDVAINMSDSKAMHYLIYIESNSQNELNFIQKLKHVHPDSKIILLSNNFNPKFIAISQKLGLKHFLKADEGEKVLFDKITSIILDPAERELLRV